MNCPAKTEPIVGDGHNQSPNALCADLTTRSDLGRIANARLQREHRLDDATLPPDVDIIPHFSSVEEEGPRSQSREKKPEKQELETRASTYQASTQDARHNVLRPDTSRLKRWSRKCWNVLRTYFSFVGPGFMVSVAYIDPGNYATDVAAGASYRFKLLFMILLSNIFAIFLQSLCIHLGSVTGMNLSQMTRRHCPRWLNLISYIFGEGAIIATDMAEVIGTAIALSLLSNGKIPLVAGCAISIADVLFILLFYRQNNASMRAHRAFEMFVGLLVLGVIICFCIQLSYLQGVTAGEVFHGYLPSSALVQGQGLYQACGILGATVMPHSLYLGSDLVHSRLKEFDTAHGLLPAAPSSDDEDDTAKSTIYKSSLQAIKSCRAYSMAELGISLFTFALFVNSAILIVSGAALYGVNGASNASLFAIYALLSHSLAPAVGKLFAAALLLSGLSAGIICTIVGQIISEGQIDWKMAPWRRRLLTRGISIVPAIIVAGALGGPGVTKALVGSQVALSVILPFVSAPLVWFVCRSRYMSIAVVESGLRQGVRVQDDGVGGEVEGVRRVNMRVHWVTAGFAVLIWGVIAVMNVALLVLVGLGLT